MMILNTFSDEDVPVATELTRLLRDGGGDDDAPGPADPSSSTSGSGVVPAARRRRRDRRWRWEEEEDAVESMKDYLSRAPSRGCLAVFAVVLFLLMAASAAVSSSVIGRRGAGAAVRGGGARPPASAGAGGGGGGPDGHKAEAEEAENPPSSAELHDHTIPTPLGVRHHETGLFLSALDNPLFEEMKGAEFVVLSSSGGGSRASTKDGMTTTAAEEEEEEEEEKPVKFAVDRHFVSFGDPLTVTWRGGQGDYEVGESDVMALYCPATESDPHRFRDAATVLQALRMGDDDEGASASEGRWRVRRFPTIREESCEFRLWRRRCADADADAAAAAPSESERGRRRRGRRRLLPWEEEEGATELVDEPPSPPSRFELVASTGPFHLRDAMATPTAVHLSLGDDPTEMVVHFTTGVEGTPAVRYSGPSGRGGQEMGTSSTYGASDLCQAPANLTEPGKFLPPGQLHVVRLRGLEADSDYTYRVGVLGSDNDEDEDAVLWSEPYAFRTAPPVGSASPFSFLAYGDQGCPGNGWESGGETTVRRTVREAEGPHSIRMIHHLGDLSYAQGAAHIWDDWFDMISSFSPRVPLMIGVGNHEYDHTAGGEGGRDPSGVTEAHGFMPPWGNFGADSGGECGVPTQKRFVMPSNGNGVFWYSYDYGSLHTVVISSEHDLSPGSAQRRWLEADLRSVDRDITPWLVVESHRPMYHVEDKPENTAVAKAMRDEIEDLLRDHRVDLFLAGHYHSYHRTCAGLYRSRCDDGGPTHITVGSAGAQLDLGVGLLEDEYTKFYAAEWGYGRATVANGTALHWEFVADEDGTVRDEVWLIKEVGEAEQ